MKVIPKGICFRCDKSNESLIHALWECKLSKKVWRLSMLGFAVEQWHMLSFIDFFEKAKIVFSSIELEQFAYICWMLWKARNDNLHSQGVHNPTHLLERSFELYEESHKSQEEPRACRVNQNEIWSCPSEGFYKLNVDGATDNATCLSSIGTVVHNDFGVFMGALAMQSPRRVSILAIEFQAIHREVLFAAGADFFPHIIETNSYENVMMINSKETIWATISNIMDDVRDSLMQFSSKEVQFRPRECNKVAHAIARFALHEQGPYYWLEEGHVWVMNYILDDHIVTNASG